MADPTKPQPPEKYALTLPANAPLLKDDVAMVEEMARKAGLTNDEAQAFLDEQIAVVTTQSEKYKALAVADKDYGGEKLAENQMLANKVIDRIRPVGHARRDAFLGFINRAGASNHPEVLGFLADLGRVFSEDRGILGNGPATNRGGDRRSHADVLFGDAKK